MDQGIPFSSLTSATSVANADELLLQQSGVTKRLTYEKLRGPIDTDAGNSIDLSINEDTASLTATLKNKAGTTLNSKSVSLPNTSNINMEVDEDTAELTVQLKNKSGAVVTEDTVTLPNTSNLEMSINSSNVLTTSLKNKSGQVVTSDSVTIPAVQSVNCTLAEYEALPDTKLTDGVYYNIIESNEIPEDETINGNKNFTGTVKVKGNEVVTKAEYKQVRETIVNYTYTNKGAGASGFITLNLPQGHSVALNNIIAVISQTGTISGSYGLQFTYVYISGDIVYMNYYQPKAISESVDIVFRIKYFK